MQTANLDKHALKSSDGRYSLTSQFIGDDYLKLKLPRDLIPDNKSVSQHSMPNLFEIVGIQRDLEKEREERRKAQAKRKRSPLPHETWFEMTHSMGSWKQSRYF
jgi:hypothetical protein